jgi:HAD superfamily hydrolase (TIGR01509 family)
MKVKGILFDFWNTIAIERFTDVILIPGVREALERLKKTHKLGVLSNTSSGRPRQHLKDHDLEQYFEYFFFSVETGHSKPDEQAYLHACKNMGLMPEECAYIDDKRENVEGAKAAGMVGIHFDGSSDINRILEVEGIIS